MRTKESRNAHVSNGTGLRELTKGVSHADIRVRAEEESRYVPDYTTDVPNEVRSQELRDLVTLTNIGNKLKSRNALDQCSERSRKRDTPSRTGGG